MNKFIKMVIDELEEYDRVFDYSMADEFENSLNCHVYYGETRYCIVFDEWDYVIKIPRYDGRRKGTKINYCQIEEDNYNIAKKYHVEEVLLPIKYIGEFYNNKIYIQKKFTCTNTIAEKESREKRNEMRVKSHTAIYSDTCGYCMAEANCSIDDVWFGRVLSLYGKDFIKRFSKYTVDIGLNDLHNNNIGWLKNRPVILDYAGYYGYGDCSSESY